MKERKPLTASQLEACRRLRELWDARAKILGLSQEAAAGVLGCNQSAVNHWLTGRTAIGFEAMFRWADLLRAHPYEIDPTFAERIPVSLRMILDACTLTPFAPSKIASPYQMTRPSRPVAVHDGSVTSIATPRSR